MGVGNKRKSSKIKRVTSKEKTQKEEKVKFIANNHAKCKFPSILQRKGQIVRLNSHFGSCYKIKSNIGLKNIFFKLAKYIRKKQFC